MRAWMLGLAFLWLPAVALAQNTKPAQSTKAPPAAKSDPKIDKLLREWDLKSRDLVDLDCEFRRITREKLFKTEKTEYGEALAIRPYRARIDLKDEKGNFTEIIIYTGKRLHVYDFHNKKETVTNLPDPEPASGQSLPGVFGFLSGMSATEAKTRFNLALAREFSKDGTDFAEIHATPRMEIDQQDFKLAQIVIDKKTYLPKELKLIEPNGNELHWIFDRLETNVNLSGKQLEPFDRRTNKVLQKWELITNNYGEPPKTSETPKTSSGTTQKARPEAGKSAPPKR